LLAILASNCAHGYSSEACAGVSAAYLLLTPTIPQACALPLQASWHSRGLAIASARKRNIALQVRLLACTVLIPLEAALERLLMNAFPALVPNLHVALYAALFSMEAIRVALIVANGVRARALATACAAHLLRSHARHGYAECRASCFSAVLYVVRAPEFLGARNGRESRCLPALFF
jgi:hypothetical protein